MLEIPLCEGICICLVAAQGDFVRFFTGDFFLCSQVFGGHGHRELTVGIRQSFPEAVDHGGLSQSESPSGTANNMGCLAHAFCSACQNVGNRNQLVAQVHPAFVLQFSNGILNSDLGVIGKGHKDN